MRYPCCAANAGVLLLREKVGTGPALEHSLMELTTRSESGLDVTLTVWWALRAKFLRRRL